MGERCAARRQLWFEDTNEETKVCLFLGQGATHRPDDHRGSDWQNGKQATDGYKSGYRPGDSLILAAFQAVYLEKSGP
jgi:hypothetical protein